MIIMIIMKGHVAPYHTHWCERMTKVDENRILHHLEKLQRKKYGWCTSGMNVALAGLDKWTRRD